MIKAVGGLTWGTDPEAFLKLNGKIVGSEKYIPEKGLVPYSSYGKIVRDGVQLEFNPTQGYDANSLASYLRTLIIGLDQVIRQNPGLSMSLDGLVEVSREELDSLSPKSRVLGCQPSFNVYGDRPITVDPETYRKRSLGGHIHIGLAQTPNLMEERRSLVPLMDIFVGNTSVLLDRDPGAAERRENYGRAGECRFPKYGLEYRTVSAFWLRNFVLLDLIFRQAAFAVYVYNSAVDMPDMWKELKSLVNIKRVIKAIDMSNFELAMENFKALEPFYAKYSPENSYLAPITNKNFGKFVKFAEDVNKNGLDKYFPADGALAHWCGNYSIYSVERFLNAKVPE